MYSSYKVYVGPIVAIIAMYIVGYYYYYLLSYMIVLLNSEDMSYRYLNE